jgi:hypothetical protein
MTESALDTDPIDEPRLADEIITARKAALRFSKNNRSKRDIVHILSQRKIFGFFYLNDKLIAVPAKYWLHHKIGIILWRRAPMTINIVNILPFFIEDAFAAKADLRSRHNAALEDFEENYPELSFGIRTHTTELISRAMKKALPRGRLA